MGGGKPGAVDSLKACVAELKADGYDAHLVFGDSHAAKIIAAASALGPFDAAFIDGDHTLEGITLDWYYYGRHVRVCGFHDVAWQKPPNYGSGPLCDCKAFWDVISKRYRSQQFVHSGGNMGIGVVWPPGKH